MPTKLFAFALPPVLLLSAFISPPDPTAEPVSPTPESATAPLLPPQIVCMGKVCGQTGGLGSNTYAYRVTPGSAPVDRVDIGVHYPVAWLMNVQMPANWSWQLVSKAMPCDPYTPHNNFTGQNGTCPWAIRFSGQGQAATFDLGFDLILAGRRHDVHWQTKTTSGFFTSANWGAVVGMGAGPVHGPQVGPIPRSAGKPEDCCEH